MTTLVLARPLGFGAWLLILLGLGIGGGIGAYIARQVPMTAMPQLVAAFHSLVGLAAVLVAAAALYAPQAFGLGGAGRDPGRLAVRDGARLRHRRHHLHGLGDRLPQARRAHVRRADPSAQPARHQHRPRASCSWFFSGSSSARESRLAFWLIVLVSFVLGVTLIIPIGGADMPVVISMLNSYSGWAAAGIGFTLGNLALIITGALVGSSGAILSYIMCKGMNRSFISVILGGFGGETAGPAGAVETRPVKQGSADDAAFIMKNAEKVIVVPGYGMAVAQAQHALREMADQLKEHGVQVKYAIHPVAGRMPGHMNVLLAEANVPYDEVFELEDINGEFPQADVAFVIGANDVTNPAAKTDPQSPIYGMPDPRRGAGQDGAVRQARHGLGLRRRRERAVLPRQHHDALRRRQEDGRRDPQSHGLTAASPYVARPVVPPAFPFRADADRSPLRGRRGRSLRRFDRAPLHDGAHVPVPRLVVPDHGRRRRAGRLRRRHPDDGGRRAHRGVVEAAGARPRRRSSISTATAAACGTAATGRAP